MVLVVRQVGREDSTKGEMVRKLEQLVGVTITPSDWAETGMSYQQALKNPYTDQGEAQMAAALEATGHYVPGSVTVKVHPETRTATVTGELKGKIHKIALKAGILPKVEPEDA